MQVYNINYAHVKYHVQQTIAASIYALMETRQL